MNAPVRAALILAGPLHASSPVGQVAAADWIGCVDGGAAACRRFGWIPDLLIGDLDSIDPDDHAWMRRQGVPERRFATRKDQTDFELAVELARRACGDSLRDILVLGAWGGRPDHSLANLLLAVRETRAGCPLRLSDGISWFLPINGATRLSLDEILKDAGRGAYVSIMALGEGLSQVRTAGLEYPLDGSDLESGSSLGVSNRPSGEGPAWVEVRSGHGVLVVTPEEPHPAQT